jgi:CRP-like cAMP-binding protein
MSDVLSLCAGLPEVALEPGESLMIEGAAGGPLFVLIEGTVSVTKGGVEVARVSTPGALFGEMSALLDLPTSATVTAAEPVRAYRSADPLGLIASSPQLAVHTARLLAERLHNATTYLADLKAQFQDQSDHFAMMDRILDAMLESQPRYERPARRPSNDPRL